MLIVFSNKFFNLSVRIEELFFGFTAYLTQSFVYELRLKNNNTEQNKNLDYYIKLLWTRLIDHNLTSKDICRIAKFFLRQNTISNDSRLLKQKYSPIFSFERLWWSIIWDCHCSLKFKKKFSEFTHKMHVTSYRHELIPTYFLL